MKHKDIAIAWLNGEEVEWSFEGKQWNTIDSADSVNQCMSFCNECHYRIKKKIPEYHIVEVSFPNDPGLHAYYAITRNTGNGGEDSYTKDMLRRVKEGTATLLGDWLPIPGDK